MTNPDSPNSVELDDLDSWGDADEGAPQHATTGADVRELVVYDFDSDKQTLVGLGPALRARRSRMAAETPDSQRMPQSEPPGPFVAGDDEIPPSFRRPSPAWWAVAAPVVLVAGLVALAVGSAASDADDAGGPAKAAPPPPVAALAAPGAVVVEVQPVVESQPVAVVAKAPEAPPPVPVPETKAAPTGAGALPVQLAEAPPPSLVTLSANSAASGTVNVTSNPPANVVLDGRPIGKSPRLVRVPAGVHKLVFIHPLYGRQSLSVTVAPGQTATAAASF